MPGAEGFHFSLPQRLHRFVRCVGPTAAPHFFTSARAGGKVVPQAQLLTCDRGVAGRLRIQPVSHIALWYNQPLRDPQTSPLVVGMSVSSPVAGLLRWINQHLQPNKRRAPMKHLFLGGAVAGLLAVASPAWAQTAEELNSGELARLAAAKQRAPVAVVPPRSIPDNAAYPWPIYYPRVYPWADGK